MKYVEMILEANAVTRYSAGIRDDGDDTTPLLFGGETFYENICAIGYKERHGVGMDRDSVAFAATHDGPINMIQMKVVGVNERCAVNCWCQPQVMSSSKVHYSACGHR